jgi:leucyl-tRNA synthetase
MNEYDHAKVEEKWQKKWEDAKLFDSDPIKGKDKFFIIFAYPGVSGFLHVGHMRGFTYADIIARYKRMCGYNVLFPAGFHASGLPSVSLAKRVARKDPETIENLKHQGVSESDLAKLSAPEGVVDYFSKIYIEEYWKKFGFSIDYRRTINTISPGYRKFIQWQFKKLHALGLLTQKPHFAPFCPSCGPVAVDASETDISKGGTAEILEFTILYFTLKDGSILPASTLRPETIFGVTNLWLNPDVEYCRIKHENKTWIVSAESCKKLELQKEVKLIDKISGKELIGQTCKIPYTNREVIILPSKFVDPNIATGVVMSVPAHAPYDWVALNSFKDEDVKKYGLNIDVKKIKPISMITTEEPEETRPPIGRAINPDETHSFTVQNVSHFEVSEYPAIEICKQLGVKNIDDKKKLDEATQIVYKKEFHTGRLKKNCGKYAGMRVSEAKEALQKELVEKGEADVFFEFSEEVVCRCGTPVLIKKIPDQWFIKYSNEKIKQNAKEHMVDMKIVPREYAMEMPRVIDWFNDRACIRQGDWLGTEFPFKKDWTIEPISDSTLYPMYYIISKYVNAEKISQNDMSEEFFDFVFADDKKEIPRSKVSKETIEKIRNEFNYWYPLDVNLGGKEHKTVHFPVFLMNHIAVLDRKFWPRGIFVHWWVTQRKGKISKSKGGAEPIPDATKKYSVDGMRLYYTHIGSTDTDIEWNTDAVLNYKQRMEKIWGMINQLLQIEEDEEKPIDKWLESVMNRKIEKILEAMENYNLRIAANEIFFEIYSALKWYLKRGGANKKIIKETIDVWLRLMSPFTPYIAEELWETTKGREFVSVAKYPVADKEKISPAVEFSEEYLETVMKDVSEILKVTNIQPKKIVLYTSPSWKETVYKIVLKLAKTKKLEMSSLMKDIGKEIDMKKYGKDAPKYAQKLIKDFKMMGDIDLEKAEYVINEKEYLAENKKFLEDEFKSEVNVYSGDDEGAYDPKGKMSFAMPRKPAIYIE